MNRSITAIFLLLGTFLSCIFSTLPAGAAKPRALYTAQVVVPTTGVKMRLQSLPYALEQVLIKVSGKKDVARVPAVNSRLASAGAYLQSYDYFTKDYGTGENILYLQVNFDPKAIRDLLVQAGQPIWGDNRPLILSWAAASESDSIYRNAQDQNGENIGALAIKILTSADKNDPLSQAFYVNADRYGLPLLFPKMDLQDTSEISAADVCNFNFVALRAAAKRYGGDIILSGCIMRNPDLSWRGQWAMIENATITRWDISAHDANELAAKVMGNVFSLLTANANSSDKNIATVLNISNVRGVSDYGALLKYVRSLNSVLGVNLVEIDGDKVILNIVNRGGIEELEEAVRAGNKLAPLSTNKISPEDGQFSEEDSSPPTQPSSRVPAELSYRWLGITQ